MEDFLEYQKKLEEEKMLFNIEQAHNLTVEMRNEANKYAKLAELAFNNELDVLKNSLRGRWLSFSYLIEGASKWLNMLSSGEKIDGRKKYEEKELYESLVHRISELLDEDVEIIEISFYGYERSAYDVVFKLKNDFFERKFELVIPETERLNKDNLDYCNYGKLRISYQPRPSCWDYICSSYNKEDLKNKFKEWLTPKPMQRMGEILYSVIDINDGPEKVVAKDMTLDNATILLKALFNEYFGEQGLAYTIIRQFSDATQTEN